MTPVSKNARDPLLRAPRLVGILGAIVCVLVLCLSPKTALAQTTDTIYWGIFNGSHGKTLMISDTPQSGYNATNQATLPFSYNSQTRKPNTPWLYCDTPVAQIEAVTFMGTNGNKLKPSSMDFWFADTEIDVYDFDDLDTSETTSMRSLFENLELSSEEDQPWYFDPGELDTSSVTDMRKMFSGMQGRRALDLSTYDTSSVTDMSSMFDGAYDLTSLNISGWNTSNVTNMSAMFSGTSLTSLDLSGLSTGSVTNMSYMFSGCLFLTSVNMSGLDVGRVTNMSYMFYDCSVQTLDLRGWTPSSLAYASEMFSSCYDLETITVSPGTDWSTTLSSGDNGAYMFSWCESLTGSQGTTVDQMFSIDDPDAYSARGARVDGLNGLPGLFSAEVTSSEPLAGTMEPSVGDPSGSGSTDLNMILMHGGERGGTKNPDGTDNDANPDSDGDGIGDNLAFTVPTAINYVVKANGSMTGPTNAHIDNCSAFAVRVSSLQVEPEQGYAIVEDASASNATNSVDLLIGPSTDQLSAHAYATKAGVSRPAAWNMMAANDGTTDQVNLVTSGHASHLASDISTATRFGRICWYVTPGAAS